MISRSSHRRATRTSRANSSNRTDRAISHLRRQFPVARYRRFSLMIVSSRSEPVETIAAGTPLVSSSFAMYCCASRGRSANDVTPRRSRGARRSMHSARPRASHRRRSHRHGSRSRTSAPSSPHTNSSSGPSGHRARDRERIESVDARRGGPQRHRPPTSARPARGRAVFCPVSRSRSPIAPVSSVGKSGANARRVGLGHAENRPTCLGPTQPGRCTAAVAFDEVTNG